VLSYPPRISVQGGYVTIKLCSFMFEHLDHLNMCNMKNIGNKKGFTLVELLVAMVITGIVMSAVATLAFAMSSANKSTDNMSEKQAQIRFATLRITDLIRYCRLVCRQIDGDLVIWRADDNNDGEINVNELICLRSGSDRGYLRLCEFNSPDDSLLTLSDIETFNPDKYAVNTIALVPQCSDVQFKFDKSPPQSRFVSISFDITEDGSVHRYQIDSVLRCRAGNLLNSEGTAIVSDDD
jgi:prepilin-type N-terminal cleavage/methylation domain-containing protein